MDYEIVVDLFVASRAPLRVTSSENQPRYSSHPSRHYPKSQTVVVRKAAQAIRRDVPHAKRRRSWPQWKFAQVGVGKSARCRLVARCQIARGLTRISTLTWPTLRGRPGPLLTRAPWRKRPPKLHVAADWSCSKRNGFVYFSASPRLIYGLSCRITFSNEW